MSILSVENLHKTYKGGVKAVDGISFEVSRGECFGLLGPNGAGKTTTIEALEGIIPFDEGRIVYDGQPVSQLSKDLIGIQFQSTALPDYLKVKEVLEDVCSVCDRPVCIKCHDCADCLCYVCDNNTHISHPTHNRVFFKNDLSKTLLLLEIVNEKQEIEIASM